MRGRLVAAQPTADLDPAGALDHPVEDDQIGRFLRSEDQRLIAIGGGADTVALVVETIFEKLQQSRIVFDQKEASSVHTVTLTSVKRYS